VQEDGKARHVAAYSVDQLERIFLKRSSALAHESISKEWMTFPEIQARFGFSRNELYDWSRNGCCHLGGEKLSAQKKLAHIGPNKVRMVWAFLTKHLEAIEGSKKVGGDVAAKCDEPWLTAKAAERKYGIWDASLSEWRENPTPYLGGRTIRAKQISRLTAAKNPRSVWVYHEEDIQCIVAAKKAGPVFDDQEGRWLFACEVSKRTGLSADNLWHYRNKSFAFLNNGRIRAKKVSGVHHPLPNCAHKQRWVYHEEDIFRLAASLKGEDPTIDYRRPATNPQTSCDPIGTDRAPALSSSGRGGGGNEQDVVTESYGVRTNPGDTLDTRIAAFSPEAEDQMSRVYKTALLDVAGKGQMTIGPQPDGPIGGDSFRLEGHVFSNLTNIEQKLLTCLWCNGQLAAVNATTAAAASYNGHTYGKEQALDKQRERLSAKLYAQSKGSWEITLKNGYLKLSHIQIKT
jgi:hypothetical protein